MKSEFIKNVLVFSEKMAKRLPITHEGGFIVVATDDEFSIRSIVAKPLQRKELVKHLLDDEDIRRDVQEILSEKQKRHE